MDLRIVFVLALGLAGCSTITGETVFLENAAGDRVQCGPYTMGRADVILAQKSLRNCVGDFQRMEYERVQSPE